jgi:hypothetical protein
VSIPFDCTLFYDSDTPNTSSTPPDVLYRFAPGSAGIRIHTADATYASDPGSADLTAGSALVYVGADGLPTNPLDPEAVLRATFLWTSNGGVGPSA